MVKLPAFFQTSCVLLVWVMSSFRTAPPRVSVPSGKYTCPQSVSLIDRECKAAIYYTTDGSVPKLSSPQYISPILITDTETLKARAIGKSRKPSEVVTAQYTCAQVWATRRDFAVMQQKTFQLPAPQTVTGFPDVPANDPDYAAIQAAAPFMNLQILCRGCMLSANFSPEVRVSRAGFTISLVRILVTNKSLQLVGIPEANGILSGVVDIDQVAIPARVYFATAIKFGVIALSSDHKLLPNVGFTRPEMTTVIQSVGQRFGNPVGVIQ